MDVYLEQDLSAFRETDILGHSEKNVDYGFFFRLGLSIGKWVAHNIGEGNSVCICSNNDLYSNGYKVAFRRGLCKYQEVLDVGEGPIELLGFSISKIKGAVAGVMISSEGEFTGVKIFNGNQEINKSNLSDICLYFKTIGSLHHETLRPPYPYGSMPMGALFLSELQSDKR